MYVPEPRTEEHEHTIVDEDGDDEVELLSSVNLTVPCPVPLQLVFELSTYRAIQHLVPNLPLTLMLKLCFSIRSLY